MSTLPGKIVLELPPGPGNPRNSEGAFIKLKDGRLMFVYSRFVADHASDVAPCCLAARYSSDGGETWSGDRVLFVRERFDRPDMPCQNIMSVSMLRMRDGALGLFFCIRYDFLDSKLHLARSYDEGETFGEPVRCVPGMGYYVTNNDRVIRTSSGRLIVPCNFHRIKSDPGGDQYGYANFFDYRAVSCFSLSDDDGKTWREAVDCCYLPHGDSNAGLQETGIVELENGTLWAYFRTDMGCQYMGWSRDDGEHWTTPEPSRYFTSPCSPMSVKRGPGGELLAVWNPIPAYTTRGLHSYGYARNPLAAAVSTDDGRSFGEPVVLENAPGGYCYIAIHFEGDSVLLAYCAGSPEDGGCLNRLRVRRLVLSELGMSAASEGQGLASCGA